MPRYNGAMAEKALKALRKGMSRNAAAGLAGMSLGQLNSWISAGEAVSDLMEPPDDQVCFLEFYIQVHEAEASIEEAMVETWTEQATENWQAAMHFLSRRFPNRWASQQRVDPDAAKKDDERVQVNVYLPDNNRG